MTSFTTKKGQDDVAEASRLIVEHFFFFFPAYGPKYYEVSDWITIIIIT